MATTTETVEGSSEEESGMATDFPTGHDESSWWPIVCVVGAIGLYLGAGLYFFSTGDNAVTAIPPQTGPVVFGGGALVLLMGGFGWLYQGFLVDFWTRGTEGREPYALRGAMVLFLTTDVATFSVGFIYYAFIRSGAWPPGEIPELLSATLVVNTVALVASSFTLHYAHAALEDGNRRRFLGLLGGTIALGVLFVFGQVYEYYGFVIDDGFTITSGLFGSAFFGLTGLHGLHVMFGTVLLGVVFARGLLGQYADDRDTSIVTVSFYWHFVDLVWIFIISLLYFGASIRL